MKTGLRRLLALALGAGLLTANTYAAATTFTDVPTTYWGYYYIDRAATEGLVSGIGDNQYGPEQTLSNAQFVTMICNMFYKTAVAANQNSSGQWWYPLHGRSLLGGHPEQHHCCPAPRRRRRLDRGHGKRRDQPL